MPREIEVGTVCRSLHTRLVKWCVQEQILQIALESIVESKVVRTNKGQIRFSLIPLSSSDAKG